MSAAADRLRLARFEKGSLVDKRITVQAFRDALAVDLAAGAVPAAEVGEVVAMIADLGHQVAVLSYHIDGTPYPVQDAPHRAEPVKPAVKVRLKPRGPARRLPVPAEITADVEDLDVVDAELVPETRAERDAREDREWRRFHRERFGWNI